MQRAKQQLFKPFRFSFWWRMAVVAFFAGEFSGSSFRFSVPGGGGNSGQSNRHLAALAPAEVFREMLPWIALAALILVVLIFLFLYVHSVFRFILFDSVLSGECRIRQNWGRRKEHGTRYFVWLILYQLLMLLVLVVLIGLPVIGLWRAGIFSHAGEHIALLILSIFFLVAVFFALVLVAWIITTMVRDFLIPIMALEDVSVGQAWHIYKPTLLRDKPSAAGYLGMKIVLAIALGMIVFVISLFFFLILLIPSVILFVAVFGFMATGKAGMVIGIVLAVVAGIILLGIWFFIAGMLSVPMAVFFQWYALYYVGSRYQRLGDLLWPVTPGEMPNPSGAPPMNPAPA
jgi:hypothetical protein